jgi:DNA-binding beta-propeller fold protein YncE
MRVMSIAQLGNVLGLAFALGAATAAPAGDLKFEHVMNIGSEGYGAGQFKYIEDFAFSRDGHLLVTDASHAWGQAFDKTTGKFIARFGGKGDDDHHLDKPEGIAVDPDGNVFVGDYSTGFVKKYDASYRWLMTFSEYGSLPGQNMKSEFMGIRDGRLYLPDVDNHRINVFELNGKALFDFGGQGTAPGKFNNPEAAKFGSDGRLYVTDLMNDRVQVFDADGRLLAVWGHTGTGKGEFKAPAGLAFDRHDNVYVTEIGNNRVQVFDRTGTHLAMWGRKGAGNGEFGNPHGIIVDKSTGYIYVADTGNNRIQVFRPVADTVGGGER